MAGRKRKTSESTVATFEDVPHRWAKEVSVLRPTPLGLPDNDWPCYVLDDAVIYRKDGHTLANPLLVHLEGPLIVRGKLEVGDDDEHRVNLVKATTKSTYIEISNSSSYSIGYDSLTLWVSGAAGWFEINPSPKYEAMFAEIREAITLYYEILNVYDAYSQACAEKKKKKCKMASLLTLDELFFKYAVAVGDGVLRDEVEARCHKWAKFLIGHFPKEIDLNWEETLFFKWMHQSHPDLKDKIASAAAAVAAQPIPEAEASSANSTDSVSRDSSLPVQSSSKTGNRGRQNSTDQDVKMRDLASGRSRSPQSSFLDKGKSKARIETPIPLPVRYQPANPRPSPVIKESSPAEEVSSDSPVDRLAAVMQVSQEPYKPSELLRVEDMPDQLVRRRAKVTTQNTSSRATASRPPGPSFKDEEEDDHPPSKKHLQPPGRTSGKGASLRLTSGSKKRSAPKFDDEDEVDGRGRGAKALKTGALVSDEDMHDTSSSDEDSVNDEDDDGDDDDDDDDVTGNRAAGIYMPLPKDAVQVVVHAERIPTMSPSGPNGTWTCGEDGCNFVVRAAEDQAAQEQIAAHFRSHEEQAEKVNLALKESRGHLPINYLLDKIQQLGQKAAQKKRGTLNGEPLVAPIKRRLIV
ncbi:hypothetical protein B0H63DRAFT_525738 [Podospora didyma]|uniref:DNA (cytosine-5)-methyltransferase 1 replication foci domain-containing protein n=1 Tax=Podospora didyma TaxID=330526 RepID=A0AAE0KMA6_9PEZI|nr:hypothetical protein B0H63DRAFT_525738 [Podospora didyma]